MTTFLQSLQNGKLGHRRMLLRTCCLAAAFGLGRTSIENSREGTIEVQMSGNFLDRSWNFGRHRRPSLVSTDSPVELRDACVAYGNGSLGTQPMLIMDHRSEVSPAEGRFLLSLLGVRHAAAEPFPNGLIAWVAPRVDGLGILVAPNGRGNQHRLLQNFRSEILV
jgi:hypothetical protein